jgi:hypothetical protein
MHFERSGLLQLFEEQMTADIPQLGFSYIFFVALGEYRGSSLKKATAPPTSFPIHRS